MIYPSWPEGVKYRMRRSDFRVVERNIPPVQTAMSGGNVRMRSTVSVSVGKLQCAIQLPDDEYTIFHAWVRDDLGRGASRFTMPILYPPSTYLTKICWFDNGATPSGPSAAAGHQDVSFILMVLDF